MEALEAKEKFSCNLQRPEDRVFNVTVLYMTYKTIKSNNSITLNQLRWLLQTEYMLQVQVIDGAVASLTSRSLFHCVSRWSPPKKHDAVHLRVRHMSAEFTQWLKKVLAEFPELEVFTPPIFSARSSVETKLIP